MAFISLNPSRKRKTDRKKEIQTQMVQRISHEGLLGVQPARDVEKPKDQKQKEAPGARRGKRFQRGKHARNLITAESWEQQEAIPPSLSPSILRSAVSLAQPNREQLPGAPGWGAVLGFNLPEPRGTFGLGGWRRGTYTAETYWGH